MGPSNLWEFFLWGVDKHLYKKLVSGVGLVVWVWVVGGGTTHCTNGMGGGMGWVVGGGTASTGLWGGWW